MVQILDQYGRPLNKEVLKAPPVLPHVRAAA